MLKGRAEGLAKLRLRVEDPPRRCAVATGARGQPSHAAAPPARPPLQPTWCLALHPSFELPGLVPSPRRVAVFMGASILASIMADSPELWVSKDEWGEDPGRALRKCAGALAR